MTSAKIPEARLIGSAMARVLVSVVDKMYQITCRRTGSVFKYIC